MEPLITRREFLISTASATAAALAPGCQDGGRFPHRYIDSDRCQGDKGCLTVCPMGAISLREDGKAAIDPHECAECGACQRSRVCPHDAIQPGRLNWPRTLRESFSNPLAEHSTTRVYGRGTEGIKTNDVTERYRAGQVGVFVELGRPVLGTRFSDVEKVLMRFHTAGFKLLEDNPVISLLADEASGRLRPEVLGEKATSVLLEFMVPANAASAVPVMLRQLSGQVDTVFCASVALRADATGRSPFSDLLPPGFQALPNGKVNLGLGRLGD